MGVKIDRRPIWVLLGLKGLRTFFFLAIFAAFLYVVWMPLPEGLTPEGKNAIAIFLLCLVFWVSNVIPLAVTSIFAIVLVPLLGVMPREVVYGLFGNEAVFFILGAFILAGAVMHSGLSNRIALAIMERNGDSPKGLLLRIYLLSAVLSCFMSEHAVAAMLFPIVFEIAKGLNLRPGKSGYGKLLFLSLAWGCIIGGIATFLGGARVPLAVGILKETTGATIGFFEYSVAVMPIAVIMLAIGYVVLTRSFKCEITSVAKAHAVLEKRIHAMGKITVNEYAVGTVLVLTVFAWILWGHSQGLATIALFSVVVLFIFKLVRWKDIEEYVNWGIILMYGGAIILGTALEQSGAAYWLADRAIGGWISSPWAAVAFFSFLTLLFTVGISNAAVIAILLPVAVGLTSSFGMNPTVVAYAIAVPAGLAFCLPLSTPANAIVVASNYISVRDMAKIGIIMSICAWIVFNLVARFYWPLVGVQG
ncbi:Sodium-dependent anion transporter family [hydrothermal vent metagenome]|uniref:Sodium-dependent anion transporter family n=1 Tax=hydrothermal vent metagenome TaxID=652676 RepID=A0A3B0RLU9_9ZZZZ